MDLIGLEATHITWGKGRIVEKNNTSITIDFSSVGQKKLIYPDAFKKFLRFVDEAAQAEYEKEIAEIAAARENAARNSAEAEESENRPVVVQVNPVNTERVRETIPQTRIAGSPFTFLVFQGSTFEEESSGGYIWAPINSRDGRSLHHWERLLELRLGDVIFHCADGKIRAISCVVGEAQNCIRPGEYENWEMEGRKVECKYYVLEHPLNYRDYRNTIIEHCDQITYAPFNRNGDGNLGYLYELKLELARFFLSKIQTSNPSIADLPYLSFLI